MQSTEQQALELQNQAEGWDLQESLKWGLSQFGKSLAIASSFGAEDVVLIDQASRLGLDFRVFTLDTDFLFPETYALIDAVEKRYGIQVERTHSEFTPEQQAARFGEALWASQPDQCCQLRKVEPLKKMLSGLKAWVTGVRRDQAPTRAHTRKLEWDAKFGLVKLNPIADWNAGPGVGVHPRQQRPLQSFARPQLSEHRLHLLHAARAARRRPARRPLVRIQQD